MKFFTPYEYLLIDAASQFGLDKLLYENRIKWAKDNLNQLEELIDQADEPNMFLKSVIAIRDTQAGIPTGHLVGFDSAASGIQLMSVTARCNAGMRNTGVLNSGIVPDIYRTCTEVMNVQGYTRKKVKLALMTYFYGSEAEPKNTFGEGEILDKFFDSAQAVAPEAFDLRNILINIWQPFATYHEWTMPDGGIVHKRVWQTKEFRIKEPLVGSSFTMRAKINEGTERGVSLAADVVHSIDAYLLRELGRRCNFDVELFHTALSMIKSRNVKVTDRSKLVSLALVPDVVECIDMFDDNTLAILEEAIETCINFGSFETVFIHK